MRKLLALVVLGGLLMSNASAEKVVVVGWDGADWDYIQPLMEKGEMPNLEAIMEEGDSGNLESSLPIMSPVAWTSYSTGTDPSIHGIYDFLQRKNGEFSPTTSNDIKKPYYWDLLGEDKNVLVMNVPVTFPPKKTNGVLVSGYLASNDTDYTYPSELSEELNSEGYIIETLSQGYDENREEQILERANKTVKKRTETALKLYRRENPEFFQVTYTGLDRLQHYFPLEKKYGDTSAVKNHYRQLDRSLGKLQSNLDDNSTIIVMSDHGFEPLETEVYLNHWMKEEGYLKVKEDESFLGKLGITQQRIAPLLRKFGLLEPLKTILGMAGFDPSSGVPQPTMNSIDLNQTKAYTGNYGGGVYIVEENVENPAEFKRQLKEELDNIQIGEEKTFRSVKDSEEVYSQDKKRTPDIIVRTRSGYHVVGFLGRGKISSTNTEKIGMHSLNGILATNNEQIDVSNADITDMAPTLMDLLGEEKPDYMTGQSLLH